MRQHFMSIFPTQSGVVLARILCVLLTCGVGARAAQAQRVPPGPGDATARLEAEQQRKEGDVFYADGKVEIYYDAMVLRADHVQYNAKTNVARAQGHVQLDVNTQHLLADSAELNVRSGAGVFEHVRGEVKVERRANPNVLVTPNPLSFEAREVRRLDQNTYLIENAWLTVCEPDKPSWKFYTTHATLRVDHSAALVNANFRLFRVPLLYLPYATLPVGKRVRQSGFLVPEFADTTLKGVVLGDAYYWAPTEWLDATIGAAYLSRRGSQQNVDIRAKPWEDVSLSAQYFGVIDRGLPNSAGVPVKQGGHSAQVELDARLKRGWRAVVDYNQLSSLVFRLAFAPTFGEAINSEVRSTAFLTNNFRGFSANVAAQDYTNFLTVQPQTQVNLRGAPEARFSSVDQAPWKRLPFYFGFDVSAGAVHREDLQMNTREFVERTEVAPRVVLPLHWKNWLGVTTRYTLRNSTYGAQILSGTVVSDTVRRTTGELSIDIRPASLARVWGSSDRKWKHTIEPAITYNYVRGVNQFDRFIRFNEDSTLTDTNEFEYSITQRLFRRIGEGQAAQLVSWRIAQKYYFDPTFNGALVPGTRNVFQALNSLSPFAFADQPRHFSPIVSDFRVLPGGRYDGEVRLEYDPMRRKLTTAGTILKLQPRSNLNFTVAHFSVDNASVLQPLANQIRGQVGYGQLNGRGWNTSFGFSYDIKQQFLQSQLVQVGYNGSCCGIAFEYRRLALGPVRTENQFRVAFIIANIGTFGNLRRQEKLF